MMKSIILGLICLGCALPPMSKAQIVKKAPDSYAALRVELTIPHSIAISISSDLAWASLSVETADLVELRILSTRNNTRWVMKSKYEEGEPELMFTEPLPTLILAKPDKQDAIIFVTYEL